MVVPSASHGEWSPTLLNCWKCFRSIGARITPRSISSVGVWTPSSRPTTHDRWRKPSTWLSGVRSGGSSWMGNTRSGTVQTLSFRRRFSGSGGRTQSQAPLHPPPPPACTNGRHRERISSHGVQLVPVQPEPLRPPRLVPVQPEPSLSVVEVRRPRRQHGVQRHSRRDMGSHRRTCRTPSLRDSWEHRCST